MSEQAYRLAKTCSSEAYYYINKDAEDPETELFVPVLLRKTAVAWNISYVIEAFRDVTFIDGQCSRDNRIRLRRSMSGKGSGSEKAYFMYDFPAGHSRQIGVVVNWDGPASFESLDVSDVIFKLRVEYTNIKGERFWQEQLITKHEVMEAYNLGQTDSATMAATCKHDLQMISSNALRAAAEHVKSGDKRKSRDVMMEGKRDLEKLMNDFGQRAQETTSSQNTVLFKKYAKSVVDNLGALIETIEEASTGESWNKMKAVSTAIVRESPNVSDSIVDGNALCPIPDVEYETASSICDSIKRLKEKRRRLSPVLSA